MKSEIVVSVALATVVLSGCDFFEFRKSKVEILKLEQEKAERDAIQKKDAAAALKTYVEGKCRLIMDDAQTVSNAIAALDADSAELEKAVADEMGKARESDGLPSVAVSLKGILGNPTVNGLAKKYLTTGFAAQGGIFAERVKAAVAEERTYREAIRRTEMMFERNVSAPEKWQAKSTVSTDSQIVRLRREIKELENKLRSERKKLVSNASVENERQANVIDYENQLRTKREQIDRLRHPARSQQIEKDATVSRQSVLNEAERLRRNELWDIDRHFKPKTTALEIVRETEDKTVGALRREIQNRRATLAKRQGELAVQVRTARETLLEVTVCDEMELKQLRLRMDKALSTGSK